MKRTLKFNPETGHISASGISTNINTLLNDLTRARAEFEKLNRSISSVPYHPTDLGLNGLTPKPLRQIERDLADLLLKNNYNDTLANSIRQIQTLGRSPKAVERRFWREVGKTYGFSGPKTKKYAQEKKLRVPSYNKGTRANSSAKEPRYSRLVEYTRENVPRTSISKLNGAGQKELLNVIQHYEITGRTLREFFGTKGD